MKMNSGSSGFMRNAAGRGMREGQPPIHAGPSSCGRTLAENRLKGNDSAQDAGRHPVEEVGDTRTDTLTFKTPSPCASGMPECPLVLAGVKTFPSLRLTGPRGIPVNRLAVVTTIHHVIDRAGLFQSGACEPCCIPELGKVVNTLTDTLMTP